MAGGAAYGALRLNNIVFDTSVLLDEFLRREPWFNAARLLFDALDARRIHGAVLASSLTDVYYVARKTAGRAAARDAVAACLHAFEFAEVGRVDIDGALARFGPDFEDDLVIVVAERVNADYIVRRDPAGFRDSPVPAISPGGLLALIA